MRESNKHLAAWVNEMYYHLKCKGYADQTAAACMKESENGIEERAHHSYMVNRVRER